EKNGLAVGSPAGWFIVAVIESKAARSSERFAVLFQVSDVHIALGIALEKHQAFSVGRGAQAGNPRIFPSREFVRTAGSSSTFQIHTNFPEANPCVVT